MYFNDFILHLNDVCSNIGLTNNNNVLRKYNIKEVCPTIYFKLKPYYHEIKII